MQFIVLDLEWNQPVSYQSAAYRKVGDSLLFEVIQIGAAKLNEKLEIVDTISVLICPTHYLTIHPRVKRMTGLSMDVLGDAPAFPEAMTAFADWCGGDCAFLTWGCDDVSVLKQNMDFFRVEQELPKMYDIQRLYADAMKLSGQTALKTAMEALGIEPDEQRSFHNAENDAYYTAQVLQKLPDPMAVLKYEEQPRKLSHNDRRSRFRATSMVPSVKAALESDALTAPRCPTCNQPTELSTELVPQAVGKYVALSRCKHHGLMFVKARFALLPDGQKGMHLSVLPANRQTKAYVHTKELQYQLKRKRGDYDSVDVENLEGALSTNMPFEDA
ncbi:MAG: exonuclease domain-containing protein [Clostridiales bacterium]|nr:exonuclease domain-containing protein [Clostridiales bacterium]